MTIEALERMPRSRYLRYRDHFRDYREYQREAWEDAQNEQG